MSLWLAFLSDPVFIVAVLVFVFVMVYFYWVQNREKMKSLKERLKRLEEQQANKNGETETK